LTDVTDIRRGASNVDPSVIANFGTFITGGTTTVNRLGYGTMQLTGPGVWGDPSHPDEAIRVLRRAVERGVHLIDPADSYGPFVAEAPIRRARNAPAWLLKRSPAILPIPRTSSVKHLEGNFAAAAIELSADRFHGVSHARN
jgi:aryl-alcohol dehydrogenase-like predicted oxidoreductase